MRHLLHRLQPRRLRAVLRRFWRFRVLHRPSPTDVECAQYVLSRTMRAFPAVAHVELEKRHPYFRRRQYRCYSQSGRAFAWVTQESLAHARRRLQDLP